MSIVIARIITGSGVRHNLTLTDQQTGSAINITSATISIALKNAAGTTLATKTTGGGTVTISSGSAGTFYVDFAAADYATATAPMRLYCTVTVTLSSGKVHLEEYVEPLAAIEPVAGQLAQLSMFKEYLGITGTGDDWFLFSCLDRARAAIERFCNRIFGTASYTEDIDGSDSATLCVKNPPITTLTSVSSLSRASDGTETATAMSAGNYRFDANSGRISLLGGGEESWGGSVEWAGDLGGPAPFRAESPRFSAGFRNYRVVYVGGYATGSVPADVEQACLEVATDLYRMRRVNKGMASESISSVSFTAKTTDELVRQRAYLLDPFRMHFIG